jgi:hypothetical protein
MRDELYAKARPARRARGAARRLSANGFPMARLGTVEREAAVALLHLIAKLDVEAFRAHAAGLGHCRHRVLQSTHRGPNGQESVMPLGGGIYIPWAHPETPCP